jgi:hypothetical protein
MLVRAMELRSTITVFTAQNLVSNKDEKNLSEYIMSKEDWQYCSDVIAFMKPLYLLVKDLEGKPESGANGFIADLVPAFDYIESHLEEQLEAFESQTFVEEVGGVLIRSMVHTNTLNAQAKLLKYKKLNISPILFAACVLVPWRKWSYFEEGMTEEELLKAKRLVQDLWTTKCAQIPVESSSLVGDRGGGSRSEASKVSLASLSRAPRLY